MEASREGVRSQVGFIAPIEGLRGIAVLLVVLFHYAMAVDPRFADPWLAAIDGSILTRVIVRNGMLGVDLFAINAQACKAELHPCSAVSVIALTFLDSSPGFRAAIGRSRTADIVTLLEASLQIASDVAFVCTCVDQFPFGRALAGHGLLQRSKMQRCFRSSCQLQGPEFSRYHRGSRCR